MKYRFKCEQHGEFEVNQPITAEHKANCSDCGAEARRLYPRLQWIWSGTIYRADGSRREENDYAILKG